MDAAFAGRTAMALPTFARLRRATAFGPSSLAGLAFWHDLSDAVSVTLNGTGIAAVADKGSNGFAAQQATAANQPDQLTGGSGINTRSVASFLAANNDRLQLSGGADICRAVPGFSFAAVIRVPAIGATQRFLTITRPDGSIRFAITIAPTGALQVATRRLDTDASSTLATAALVSAGTGHFIAGTVDYASGTLSAQIDGAFQTGAAAWATGPASDNTNSNTNPTYGWLGSSTLTGDLGESCAFQRALTPDEIASLRSYFRSKWGLA